MTVYTCSLAQYFHPSTWFIIKFSEFLCVYFNGKSYLLNPTALCGKYYFICFILFLWISCIMFVAMSFLFFGTVPCHVFNWEFWTKRFVHLRLCLFIFLTYIICFVHILPLILASISIMHVIFALDLLFPSSSLIRYILIVEVLCSICFKRKIVSLGFIWSVSRSSTSSSITRTSSERVSWNLEDWNWVEENI